MVIFPHTLNITAGNISSIIWDHLIQCLIEPSSSNGKLEETCKLQKCYKNFDKAKFKNDLPNISWKEHCSNPDSTVALEYFLEIINKLLDKHVISRFCSYFAYKPWITTTIANSIKSKNNIDKNFVCKEIKPQQPEIYESSLKLIRTILQHY